MPHTFSRTQVLFDDFTRSFTNADEVILLPIYASARETKGTVTSKDLAKKIKNAHFIASMEQCAKTLQQSTIKNNVVILMGAGDTFRVWDILHNS